MSFFFRERVVGTLNWKTVAMNSTGLVVLAAIADGRLYSSTDGGLTLTERMPAGDVVQDWSCVRVSPDGSIMMAATHGGRIWKSINGGVDWAETQPMGAANKNWNCVAMDDDGSVLAAVGSTEDGKIYTSVNGGVNWSGFAKACLNPKCIAISGPDGSLMIHGGIGASGRLWLSTNTGGAWTETRPAGDADKQWFSCDISDDGQVMIACVNAGRLWFTVNGGTNWTEARPSGEDADKGWLHVSVSGDGTSFVAVNSTRAWVSLDTGGTWTELAPYGNVDKVWYGSAVDDDGTNVAICHQTGKLISGSLATFPSEDDVRLNVAYTDGTVDYVGNRTDAPVNKVQVGTQYGANGTEYTGSMSPGGGSPVGSSVVGRG